MKLSVIFLIISCFCLCNISAESENDEQIVVATKNGKVRGEKLKTLILGKTYYSFKGIPYAKPPVGDLRFQPPEPIEKWSDIRNATKHGSSCTQLNRIPHDGEDKDIEEELEKSSPLTIGDEDCLYLNIYTPDFSAGANLPVMFYIHGGGLFVGKGDSDELGPDFLIERDVILVTLNYRLGIFGFLSIEDTDITGNMGLKDQQLALKWIFDNIPHFGGYRNGITVFGHSSGASSTQYHILNPESSKLFQRAILLSGSTVNAWGMGNHNQEDQILRKFAIVMPDIDDRESLLEFLKKENSQYIISKVPTYFGPRLAYLTFLPVVEDSKEDRPFILEDPLLTLSRPSFSKHDTMFGYVTHESYMFIKSEIEDAKFLSRLDKEFVILFPTREFDFITGKNAEKAFTQIRKHYFGESGKIDMTKVPEYVELTSDAYFNYGIYRTVKYHAKNSNGQTYYFRFGIDGQLNLMKNITNITVPCTTHADELCYIFRCEMFDDVYKQMANGSLERKSIDGMTTYLVNFAKFGAPIPGYPEQWPSNKNDDEYYVNINNDGISLSMHPNKRNFLFWTQLLKKFKDTDKKGEP